MGAVSRSWERGWARRPSITRKVLKEFSRLATAAGDGVIRIFDWASGKQLGSVSTHVALDSLAVSADGRRLLAGTEQGTLEEWDPAQPSLTRSWQGHAGSV